MKTPIGIKDIRKGDLIRWESMNKDGRATEYRALQEEDAWYLAGNYYLLERPESPFEPHWGMVIGEREAHEDGGAGIKAVYVPARDDYPWFSHPESGSGYYYYSDAWAKQKLAEGWVIIEKPEGVK